MKALVLAGLLVLASPAAVAAQTQPDATPKASGKSQPAAEADAGVRCERKRKLGSQMTERVCTTEAERLAAKDEANEKVQRAGRCSGADSVCASTTW